MKQVKSKESAQGPEPCSREFREDDCGLSDLARSQFNRINTEDARSSDRKQKPKGN
jgi:hypothetical protein